MDKSPAQELHESGFEQLKERLAREQAKTDPRDVGSLRLPVVEPKQDGLEK